MQRGIELLETNSMAFRAFQLANTAIYLQMFQNQWHFGKKRTVSKPLNRGKLLNIHIKNMQQKIFLIRIKPEVGVHSNWHLFCNVYRPLLKRIQKTEIWLICFISQQVEEKRKHI